METDWFALWRELTEVSGHWPDSKPIQRYKAHSAAGQERTDPLLDLVTGAIERSDTVLDIGAGNGRWSIPCACKAAAVTALEPSAEMRAMLARAIAAAGLDNITIVPESWEEAYPQQHDIIVCAHAMYASPDLREFIEKMGRHARKTCCLALRLPPSDGIIGRLSLTIYGRVHDSPNAIIAYNALYAMGIYADMIVEEQLHPWVNHTFDDAFARAKRHLHLEGCTEHDELVRITLKRHLTAADRGFIWPDGMRSALLRWHPAHGEQKSSIGRG